MDSYHRVSSSNKFSKSLKGLAVVGVAAIAATLFLTGSNNNIQISSGETATNLQQRPFKYFPLDTSSKGCAQYFACP